MVDTDEKKALQHCVSQSLHVSEKKAVALSSEREKSLWQAAKVYGFQRGFQWHYEAILRAVRARADRFAMIFDFEKLLIDGRVLPPVILSEGPVTSVPSDTFARRVEARYRIVKKARIVSMAPRFDSYLHADTVVLQPNPAFQPKNRKERALWEEAVRDGWEEGERHARNYFDEAMQRLTTEFRGILLCKRLTKLGLVSLPLLDHEHVGIEVGNDLLSMNQDIFRLLLPASFRYGVRECAFSILVPYAIS
ncbi:MAG: type IV secretory system conjugative DNA transfer family protein [Desulfovibrio sp.]|nr:type IV secretory system conjugative DNA transfer family protein [Desulfovibrio sp.]